MDKINTYEIGIIGGGPAGSSAALLLSKAGFNVCLFEKKHFPRETVCGEFLSREVFLFLEENGLEKQFLSLNPNPINTFRIFFVNNTSIETNLNFTGYGLKRSTFDAFLLDAAINSGVTVFQPAEVTEIIKDDKKFVIKYYDSGKDENYSVLCKNVIAAYGKQNILDKKLNREFVNEKSGLNGIKFHFDADELPGFQKNEIQIYTTDSMYCGVNAVNENKVTVCFLEDRKKYDHSSRKHLQDFIKQNKSFSKLVSGKFETLIESSELYGTGNIYFGRREITKEGIFMAGDAANIIAPLAGDGISIALQNAKVLESIFRLGREQKLSHAQKEILYKNLWNRYFNKRMFYALRIQDIIFNKPLNSVGRRIVAVYPGIIKYLINSTRG